MARQLSVGNTNPRPLVKASAFFSLETCTLPVRVHDLATTSINAHVLLDPDYCIIPYDVYYQYFQQFPDIVMQTTRIKTTKIDNISHSVVGRVMLKLFVDSFAMRVEFLVTAPTRHSTTHRLILGRDFINSYVDSPFTDNFIRFLLPFSVYIPCKCSGAYCNCPQLHVVVRHRRQTPRPYY